MEIPRYIPETDRVKTTERLRALQDPQVEKTPQILFQVHADVSETNKAENYSNTDELGFMRYGDLYIGVEYGPEGEEELPYSTHLSINNVTEEQHLFYFNQQPDGSYTAFEDKRTPERVHFDDIPPDVRNMIVVNLFNAFTTPFQEQAATSTVQT